MRSLSAIIVATLFVSCTTASAESAPGVAFDPARLDFGAIRQGQQVERRVMLRNVGSGPQRIASVELTPPLQLASMPAYLPPGVEVRVNLTLDARALEGHFEGEVRFRFSDPDTSISLMVTAIVVPPLEFRPRRAFFVSARKGRSAEGTIEIVSHEGPPLTITKADHAPDRFTTVLEPVEPGKRYRIKVVLKPDAAVGRRKDRIVLHTTDVQRPTIELIAHTSVRERVYTFPDAVDMGSLPRSAVSRTPGILEHTVQTLMVYQEDGTDFRASFSTDVPHLTISAERGPKGDRWQAAIRQRYQPDLPEAFSGTITIRTNDAEIPVLTIPVTGSFR